MPSLPPVVPSRVPIRPQDLNVHEAEAASLRGRQLGSFKIEAELGLGGLGTVYRATASDGQTVAIKVFDLRGIGAPATAEAFEREAAITRRLNHPDIVRIHASGVDDGLAWLAMEYLRGGDLAPWTRPSNLLSPARALQTCARIADALAHAHDLGIVHRDVKPSNILVDPARDQVKVSDFGLARLGDMYRSRTGILAGTPDYMSPEQLVEGPVDHRTDLYALGVLAFELLTGRRPHQAETLGELMRRVAMGTPPDLAQSRPELPTAVTASVNALLARHPADRPRDAQEVARLWRAQAEACDGLGPKSRA